MSGKGSSTKRYFPPGLTTPISFFDNSSKASQTRFLVSMYGSVGLDFDSLDVSFFNQSHLPDLVTEG